MVSIRNEIQICKIIKYACFMLAICIAPKCNRNTSGSLNVSGPYLGQKPPGKTAEIFAPGIISTGHDERIACFSSDGRELYFILFLADIMGSTFYLLTETKLCSVQTDP